MDNETLVNEVVAVLVDENGSETMVMGIVLDETSEYLTLAYYLNKSDEGVSSKDITINKDYIKALRVWPNELHLGQERIDVEPQQLALSFSEDKAAA